jgi:hypothetical protein
MPRTVPEHWKQLLRQYVREKCGEERDHLSSADFPADQCVHLSFPDGSHALFRYAFVVKDSVSGEVAVFTEHCGYHVFPLGDAEIEEFRHI